jgi:hypothetical protein
VGQLGQCRRIRPHAERRAGEAKRPRPAVGHWLAHRYDRRRFRGAARAPRRRQLRECRAAAPLLDPSLKVLAGSARGMGVTPPLRVSQASVDCGANGDNRRNGAKGDCRQQGSAPATRRDGFIQWTPREVPRKRQALNARDGAD